MKVKELIHDFEILGYDDDTELNIGVCDYDGNWFKVTFSLEDEDRKYDPDLNELTMIIDLPNEYIEEEVQLKFEDKLVSFSEEIDMLATRYLR